MGSIIFTMSIYLPLYLSIHSSIHPFYLSIYLSIYLFCAIIMLCCAIITLCYAIITLCCYSPVLCYYNAGFCYYNAVLSFYLSLFLYVYPSVDMSVSVFSCPSICLWSYRSTYWPEIELQLPTLSQPLLSSLQCQSTRFLCRDQH